MEICVPTVTATVRLCMSLADLCLRTVNFGSFICACYHEKCALAPTLSLTLCDPFSGPSPQDRLPVMDSVFSSLLALLHRDDPDRLQCGESGDN